MSDMTITAADNRERILEAIRYGTIQAETKEELYGYDEIADYLEQEEGLSRRTIVKYIRKSLEPEDRVEVHEIPKNGGSKKVFSIASDLPGESFQPTIREQIIDTVRTLRRRLLREPMGNEVHDALATPVEPETLEAILRDLGDRDDVSSWHSPSLHKVEATRARLKRILTQAVLVDRGWDAVSQAEAVDAPEHLQGDHDSTVMEYLEQNADVVEAVEVEVMDRDRGRPQQIKLHAPPHLDRYLPATWYHSIDVTATGKEAYA